MKKNPYLASVIVAVLVLAFSATAFAANPAPTLSKKELKSLLATAKTSADHLRLAEFYRQESQRLEAKAKYHEDMATLYQNKPLPFEGKYPYGTVGLSHCRQFEQLYQTQAQEAEALARLHIDMAKAAEQHP